MNLHSLKLLGKFKMLLKHSSSKGFYIFVSLQSKTKIKNLILAVTEKELCICLKHMLGNMFEKQDAFYSPESCRSCLSTQERTCSRWYKSKVLDHKSIPESFCRTQDIIKKFVKKLSLYHKLLHFRS